VQRSFAVTVNNFWALTNVECEIAQQRGEPSCHSVEPGPLGEGLSSVQEIRDVESTRSNRIKHHKERSMKVFQTEAPNDELELFQRCGAKVGGFNLPVKLERFEACSGYR